MDEDLKLVEEIDHEMAGREPGFADVRGELLFRCAATITRLHAEIEALKSDVSDLVRAGSDEATENADLRDKLDSAGLSEAELERCCKDLDLQIAELTTENERLVKERDEAFAQGVANGKAMNSIAAFPISLQLQEQTARAETAEAQRDAALEALRPFAAIHEASIKDFGIDFPQDKTPRPDDRPAWGFNAATLTWGHFRAASRILEGE